MPYMKYSHINIWDQSRVHDLAQGVVIKALRYFILWLKSPNFVLFKVYFNYTIGGETRWIYLGKICNVKPSTIFKLSNLKHEANSLLVQPFSSMSGAQPTLNVAMIGISVEPIMQIDALVPASQAIASNVNSFTEFVQKMLQNFYNYASSFAKDAPDGQQYVPLITLQNWLENFKRRFELNPNFWKS